MQETCRKLALAMTFEEVRLMPPQWVDCLAPPPACTYRWMHPVKCLALGHNKQACWHVLYTILILLSAEQGSSEHLYL